MKLTQNLSTALASMAAGLIATQVVKLAWRVAAGGKPPTDSKDLSLPTAQVAAFAAVLAGVTAVAQTLAQRGALNRLRRHEAEDLAEA